MSSNQQVSGADKLASIMKPLIAEVQAAQTKFLQEFIMEQFGQLNIRISCIEHNISNLDKKLTKNTEVGPEIIQIHKEIVQLNESIKKLSVEKTVKLPVDPPQISGLPSNVRAKNSPPQENMFVDEFDPSICD